MKPSINNSDDDMYHNPSVLLYKEVPCTTMHCIDVQRGLLSCIEKAHADVPLGLFVYFRARGNSLQQDIDNYAALGPL